MKFIFCFLLITVFSNVAIFSQCPHTPKCPFDSCLNGANGLTKNTAYQIWTLEHLLELSDSVCSNWHNGKHFCLMQDIETVEQMIGICFNIYGQPGVGSFFGNLHGRGKKISVAMNNSTALPSYPSALFVSNNGVIDSLVVDGYIIANTNSMSGGTSVAVGIAAYNYGRISNCVNNASLTGLGAFGIAFQNSNIIINCINNASLIGEVRAAGIADRNGISGPPGTPPAQIINCINTGKIKVSASNNDNLYSASGIVFWSLGILSGNINLGHIEGSENVAGVVGLSNMNGQSTDNINYGFVKGVNIVGGIVGEMLGSVVNTSNNFNSGVVIGESETGCIVGRNNSGTISNNHYDKQMCISGGIGGVGDVPNQAIGHLTKATTNNSLATFLGTSGWTYVDSLYPQITALASSNASKVGASPIYLNVVSPTDYDTYNNIRECYRINTQNNVSWTKFQPNIIEIVGEDVNLLNLGTDTMYASIGIYKKTVPIVVTDTLCGRPPLDTFTLTLKTKPDTIGNTTGSGDYEQGSKVVIEAFTEHCYRFVNWTDTLGNPVSNKQKDTIILISDSVLIANFEKFPYTVSVNAGAGGTATRTPTTNPVLCGDTVIFTATADACYTFSHWVSHWVDNFGAVISEDNPLEIKVESSMILRAIFAIKTFYLTLEAVPQSGGTVEYTGVLYCGETVEITATANPNYIFSHWTDGEDNWFSDNETETVLMDTSKHYIAHFEEVVYGQFRVRLTSNLAGANLTGQGFYDSNTVVPIRATTTNNCYDFKHWQNSAGDVVSVENPYLITVESDTTLRAIFEIKRFELVLEASPTVGGTVATEGTYNCNETVEIIATANVGYEFLRWTDANNIFFSNNATETVIMNEHKHFIAHFRILPDEGQFIVKLNSNLSGAILVGENIYDSNTVVTISATTTDNCYTFSEWRDANGNFISNENPYSFIVESDTVLTAIFEIKRYVLTLAASPTVGGIVFEEGIFDCNETVEITAVANAGYTFLHWTDANNIFFSSSATETVMMDGNKHFIAVFEENIIPPPKDSFNLVLLKNPENAGTTTGSGRYEKGTEVIIEAFADSCYIFTHWSSNGIFISSENPLAVILSSDTVLVANFEFDCDTIPIPITLTFRADEHKSVSPSATNYEIPIYISANKDVASIDIKKMVLEIERNIFYPRYASNCNLTRGLQSEIILENLRVPALQAGKEIVLTKIIGDVLLGDRDSSGINFIQGIEFSQGFDGNYLFENGYITLEICEEGGGRLLTNLGYEPSLTVLINPVTETLEVAIKVIEVGDYSLEIVDLLGNTATVKEWTIGRDDNKIFDYKIPILNYVSGSYILILNTPTDKFPQKFIIAR